MSSTNAARLLKLSVLLLLFISHTNAYGQQSSKMGEVRFSADNQTERDSGVWIDGEYAGYVKELKGNRKVMLLPGEHEISIRQAGYKDFTKKIVVEPDQIQTIAVVLEENTKVIYPGNNAAELRLDILPKRAAVFVDDGYMGHGSDFGGRFHSMLVSPGKHQLKVTLDGYRTYETEINVLASNKSQMKIVLEKTSDAAPGQ
jgi:PEGA domain